MPAYWIAQYDVLDKTKYQTYAEAAGAILTKKYGAKLLSYGPAASHLEGPEPKKTCMILEFPNRESAEAAWKDEDYQKARDARIGALEIQLTLLDGM